MSVRVNNSSLYLELLWCHAGSYVAERKRRLCTGEKNPESHPRMKGLITEGIGSFPSSAVW